MTKVPITVSIEILRPKKNAVLMEKMNFARTSITIDSVPRKNSVTPYTISKLF